MSEAIDLVIIGAGPGGYVAAIRASQLGLKTVIVERSHLGGICLNWGCIPTKALLRAGELYENLSHLGDFGINVENPSFDFEKMIQRSRTTADKLSQGVAFLMKKHAVTVLEGTASLEPSSSAPRVRVALKAGGEQLLSPAAVILATGARARLIPNIGLSPDGRNVWSYKEAMFPPKLPSSLVVIGSGAIGIEFASFYRSLGSDVTVIEALDRILPVEDEEISAAARKAFEKRGIKFRTGMKVEALDSHETGVSLRIEREGQEETIDAEAAIVAIGIVGNVEGVGLDELDVAVERGHVVADEYGRTNIPGLYAIGDVAGPPWLAHKASHDGVKCAEFIAGEVRPTIHSPIPGCTYSNPAVASVGLTEAQARSQHADVKVGKYSFRNNGKAIALGETGGFIKTVFEGKTGELLGAHMIGVEVTEMIQGFVIAMTLETTEAELMSTVFPHPTLSEVMHEASLDAFGQALHG